MELTTVQTDQWSVPEIKLSYSQPFSAAGRPAIIEDIDAYHFLAANWDMEQICIREEFKIVPLNQSDRVLGIYNHSVGGVTCTVCDVRLILACALKALACAIILAHNHPPGSLEPSKADHFLTQKVKEACRYLDIRVRDHIIITDKSYYSFSEHEDL